jgi:hypothetical protein
MNMKNITVSVDNQTYRRARVVAAHKGASLRTLVADYLADLAADDNRLAEARARMEKLFAKKRRFAVGPRPSRSETYEGHRGLR